MRIAILGLIFGLATQAQDGRGRGRFAAPAMGFTALDTNGDGVLDAGEIEAAPRSLMKLDKNSDGQITSDEARPPMPMGRGGRGGPERESGSNVVEETVKTLMAFDADGDGKLSRSELPERFQGIFARGDENHDGLLTPEEIRKVAAAQSAPADGPGGRGGEMNFIRMDGILAAVDANGDGVISADEIRNSAEAIRKLDRNGDGQVTREEALPAMGRGRRY